MTIKVEVIELKISLGLRDFNKFGYVHFVLRLFNLNKYKAKQDY